MKTKLAALYLIVLALAGQSKPRNDEPLSVLLARVPEKARAKSNPLERDPEAPAAGKKLFQQHCADCHGESAEGAKRGPSLNDTRRATPGEIFWIITNGAVRHGMPAWSKLPEPQRWQLVCFLRSH